MNENEKYYQYLDKLRNGGVTNMFAAATWIADEFDIEIREARKILAEWMESYGERHEK